jgi:dipeptidase E
MKNESANKRVLLISNSTLHGSGYLDHAAAEICDFLRSAKSVLFIPYALYDRDAYALQARKRFEKMGFDLTSIHTASDPAQSSMIRRLCSSVAATLFVS